ncbi:hypothetical protein BY996DRAFT_7576468 [Phakopsora pachyrhizi]|nr:hypothetical protein BY996DRAFT_7576468 [Phakopsora pachyrhizi]
MSKLFLIAAIAAFAPSNSYGSFNIPAAPQGSFGNISPFKDNVLSLSCGLNLLVGGRVAPLAQSGYANLCLQCKIDLFGVRVSFAYTNALSESINTHGLSVSDTSRLQGFVQGRLLDSAAQSSTSNECSRRCSDDQFCQSSIFSDGRCTFTAKNLASNNKNGALLAQAFTQVFNQGGSQYCGFCSGDSSCVNPSARARSFKRHAEIARRSQLQAKCPTGLTACPIVQMNQTAAEVWSPSPAVSYECLKVDEELSSCGGCATLGKGTDCSAVEGVLSAGCSAGKCYTFSCQDGYKLSKMTNKCTLINSKPNLYQKYPVVQSGKIFSR